MQKMKDHALDEYVSSLITDKEIEAYYKNSIVGDIDISHILITPEVTDEMTDEEKTTAEKAAKKEAEDILKKLKKAKDPVKSFSELAKKYSDDEATKDKGGALGTFNKTNTDETYADVIKAAYSVKKGKNYGKVVKSSLGYHIVMRTADHDKESLDTMKDSIKNTLISDKKSNDTTLSVKSMQHYRNEMGMEITDSDIKTSYANYIQRSLTQTQQ